MTEPNNYRDQPKLECCGNCKTVEFGDRAYCFCIKVILVGRFVLPTGICDLFELEEKDGD